MEAAVKVPSAIQRQGDAADAAIKELSEGTLVEVEETKPDLEAVVEQPGEDTFEHKYNVLNGMFQGELQKRDTKIDQLMVTVENLNDLLVKKVGTPVVEEGEEAVAQEHLDPDDFEDYGAEMGDMVETVNSLVDANEKLKAENDALKGRVTDVGATVEKDAEARAKADKAKFLVELTGQVSDWQKINPDPKWLAWLNEDDPRSNIWRQTLLNDASAVNDLKRVAFLFNEFKRETGWVTPAPTVLPERNIEDEVVPDTTTGTPLPAEGDGVVVTPAQLKQAALEFTQGKITKEEYDKKFNNFQRSLAKGK